MYDTLYDTYNMIRESCAAVLLISLEHLLIGDRVTASGLRQERPVNG